MNLHADGDLAIEGSSAFGHLIPGTLYAIIKTNKMKTILNQLNFKLLISDYSIIFYLALFKILLHLLNPEYGYFRDELFFIDMALLESLWVKLQFS